MLDKFIDAGGTAEQYVAMKSVAGMDPKALSQESTTKELKEAGFSDEEVRVIIKERYYQIDGTGIQRDDDESDEDFTSRKALLEKKAAYGEKRLQSAGQPLKVNAETLLNNLRDAVRAEDLQKQNEAKFLSSVDEGLKKFPSKLTFELGEVDDKKLDPVHFEVNEVQKAKVREILSDPAKRQQYFFNPDSTIDLQKVIGVILKNEALETIVKDSFLEGGNRQVKAFRGVFPNSAYAVGVGGTPETTVGKIVKAGQPERVRQNS
jgi:hypothetical protein